MHQAGDTFLQCPWGPWSPKGAPSAFDIGPSPLQGAPAGDLVLLRPLTFRMSSVGCRRPNTHSRNNATATQHKRVRGPRGPAEPRRCIGTGTRCTPLATSLIATDIVPDSLKMISAHIFPESASSYPLHRQAISQNKKKRSGVGVEAI